MREVRIEKREEENKHWDKSKRLRRAGIVEQIRSTEEDFMKGFEKKENDVRELFDRVSLGE